eukprot:jgi/Picre1/35424/NNA_002886.t1
MEEFRESGAQRRHDVAALFSALGNDTVERLYTLIEEGADVNARHDDDNKRTVMMHASGAGDVEKVCALIEKGADVNACDNDGWTALRAALHHGHAERVNALIEAGANAHDK